MQLAIRFPSVSGFLRFIWAIVTFARTGCSGLWDLMEFDTVC